MLQPSVQLSHHLSPLFGPTTSPPPGGALSTIAADQHQLFLGGHVSPAHATSGYSVSHLLSHAGRTEHRGFNTGVFHCRVCSYTTRLKKNLKLHMRTHSGERPYACPYCPYRAAQQQNLEKHVWTHTGERPFPCPHCPDQFRQKHHLVRHVRTQHSKMPAQQASVA